MIAITAHQWRHFPRYMLAIMALVVAVNVRFIYMAVTTFPGAAAGDDFDTSNRYDAVLAAKARQDALGWSEQVTAQGLTPVVIVRGPDARPLTGAAITAQAERPIGTDLPIALGFRPDSQIYIATAALPAPGQWDLRLTVRQGGHMVKITRRIVIK